MKVNEFSKLTGINIETIRMYRNKGLLNPTKLDNGYFEYQIDDYIKLHFIKKMREYKVPLSDISNNLNLESYLNTVEKTEKAIKLQIEQLQERLKYLQMEKLHFENIKNESLQEAKLIQSIDTKVDVYDFFSNREKVIYPFYHETTPTVLIKKEYLNGEKRVKKVPIKIGIGAYLYSLKKQNIEIPTDATVIPNGIHVSQTIEIENFNEINIKQLLPMIEYAKKNNVRYISDTTAFLIGYFKRENKNVYIFRIRACIKKNEIRQNQEFQ